MFVVKLFLILLVCTQFYARDIVYEVKYIDNDIKKDLLNKRVKGSHIKVSIPSIPYSYISKLINGTLLRLSDNPQGWEYMMATSYKKIDKLTYEFTLRKGVKFQDATPFNADSVVRNINAFIKQPYTYTDIHNRLKSIEKISPYKVRFHLKKQYGMFLKDLARINIYSDAYLNKFAWSGSSTGASMKEAGNYGLGPYILTKGHAVGRTQTSVVELKANPYYYEKGMPYIENITVYTELKTKKAVDMVLNEEGKLDISPIPFNKKTEATLSKYSKLIIKSSTNNITIFFNLMKSNGILKDEKIRRALNKAIDQEKLINFVYKKEGNVAVTSASSNYDSISRISKKLKPYGGELSQQEIKELKDTLNGISLKVLTQDRFMFLWKGIEYQLKRFGVSLKYQITTSEKEIYTSLLTNRKNSKDWDILTWGNDDWFGNHPWTVFFTYRTSSKWSAIDKDERLQDCINEFFNYEYNSEKFDEYVQKILTRVYDKAYMLFVPSPNIVLAVNKEVSYMPSGNAIMPLWKAKISKYHWSVRKGKYPKDRQKPMFRIKVIK